MIVHDFTIIITVVTVLFQVAGIYLAIQAVMMARTSPSAIAWGLSLVILPYIAIPLFLIFGESRFTGYVLAGEGKNRELDEFQAKTRLALEPFRGHFPRKYIDAEELAEKMRGFPVTEWNSCHLLVDGPAAFAAMFEAIDSAQEYLTVQFYIVHDDRLGRELQQKLLAAAKRGVKCWLLFDKVGAKHLPEASRGGFAAGRSGGGGIYDEPPMRPPFPGELPQSSQVDGRGRAHRFFGRLECG